MPKKGGYSFRNPSASAIESKFGKGGGDSDRGSKSKSQVKVGSGKKNKGGTNVKGYK